MSEFLTALFPRKGGVRREGVGSVFRRADAVRRPLCLRQITSALGCCDAQAMSWLFVVLYLPPHLVRFAA